MPSQEIKWEIGSNLAIGIRVGNVDNIINQLKAWDATVSGKVLREAKWAAANVMRDAVERATPIGREVYVYQKGNRFIRVRNPRMGQARRNVIVYERKGSRYALTQTADQLSLLVGYEKKSAYYMYWYEYGTSKQSAKPFFRTTCDGIQDDALEAAKQVVIRNGSPQAA